MGPSFSDLKSSETRDTEDLTPVRIRVRIDPPHPLVCRKRRLNGAVLRMRPEKQMWHDKDPSLLKGGPERLA
jgi:hypothetical protein